MRPSLNKRSVERWQRELNAILKNDVVRLTVRNADSAAHLLRDAVRAANLYNIEPFDTLYQNVRVCIIDKHTLEVTKRSNANMDVFDLEPVVDTRQVQTFRKPNDFDEALQKIEAFVYAPGDTLVINVCSRPVEVAKIAHEKYGLFAKPNDEKLVVIKPADFKPPKKETGNVPG